MENVVVLNELDKKRLVKNFMKWYEPFVNIACNNVSVDLKVHPEEFWKSTKSEVFHYLWGIAETEETWVDGLTDALVKRNSKFNLNTVDRFMYNLVLFSYQVNWSKGVKGLRQHFAEDYKRFSPRNS